MIDTALFRGKRIATLRMVLTALLTLKRCGVWADPVHNLEQALRHEEGRSAVNKLLRARKALVMGTSMMEITTCGAVKPYSELLGGKLVAMLMASPQVVHDYRRGYRDAEVQIRSKMKREPVVRPAELVFLGTCGLYRVGASQYERIAIPAVDGAIRYRKLGETDGLGSAF